MALEIPKEDTGSIVAINALSPASLEKLVAALSSAPVVSNPHEMAEYIAKQVSIPVARLAPLIETLYTLYHIRELSGVPHPRFIDDLIEGIEKSPHLPQQKKDASKLRPLLERLLSVETLKTISKAARLQRDGERLYCEAKILSDIRPVFGSDASLPPLGAVLTHTLRISYHEGSQHKEFHAVLDSDDLTALKDLVLRAQAKDKSLRELLERTRLPNLGD